MLSALPEKVRIDYTILDDSGQSKRRLSPGFLANQDNETLGTTQRQRVDSVVSEILPSSSDENFCLSLGKGDSDGGESPDEALDTFRGRSDEIRWKAVSITSEKFNVSHESKQIKHETKEIPLVDRAVESATHTIVTDAIETLLCDESHSKVTYIKHEKELSRSTIPGVTSIIEQLFSPNLEAGKSRIMTRKLERSLSSSSTGNLSSHATRAHEVMMTEKKHIPSQSTAPNLSNGTLSC